MIERTNHADDLVAAYVLGAVTPAEVAMVEQHLVTCAECRQLADELRDIEAALPALAGEATPSPALKTRLMAAIAAEPAGSARSDGTARSGQPLGHAAQPIEPIAPITPEQQADNAGNAPAPRQEAPPAPLPLRPRQAGTARPRPRRVQLQPWLLLAAALAVLAMAVVVWQVSSLHTSTPTKVYAMGPTKALPTVGGNLSYYKDGRKLVLDLHGLKPIPANKVYELWLIKGSTVVQGVGAFHPTSDGKGSLTLTGYDVPSYTLSGVTVENAPRAAKPTLPMVAVAKL